MASIETIAASITGRLDVHRGFDGILICRPPKWHAMRPRPARGDCATPNIRRLMHGWESRSKDIFGLAIEPGRWNSTQN
jgi:hypothetical protein